MQLTWLGHATVYLVTKAGTRVLIDAWVDTNPSCPPAWHAEVRRLGVDMIVLTHGHSDHCADVARLHADTGATVYCQYDVVEWLEWQDIPSSHIVGFNKGGTVEHADVRLTMVAAQHSSAWPTAAGQRQLGNAVGFIMRVQDDITVYAAGDTAVMADMAIWAELYAPHLALLPIGDRFTMGPYEAAYAVKLLKVAAVLPIHYATFPQLTGTPQRLSAELHARDITHVTVYAPNPGETIQQGVV